MINLNPDGSPEPARTQLNAELYSPKSFNNEDLLLIKYPTSEKDGPPSATKMEVADPLDMLSRQNEELKGTLSKINAAREERMMLLT